jgi:hypothetical protein
MALDLSSYKVAFQEGSSSTKFDNAHPGDSGLVQRDRRHVEDVVGGGADLRPGADQAERGREQSGAAVERVGVGADVADAVEARAVGCCVERRAAVERFRVGAGCGDRADDLPQDHRENGEHERRPTDLLNGEITIGAGVMGTNKLARLTAFGDYKQNSGGATNAYRFQLLLGATAVRHGRARGTLIGTRPRAAAGRSSRRS